jgi:hypothetical protein
MRGSACRWWPVAPCLPDLRALQASYRRDPGRARLEAKIKELKRLGKPLTVKLEVDAEAIEPILRRKLAHPPCTTTAHRARSLGLRRSGRRR